MRKLMSKLVLKSFDEWKKAGYSVIKGQKAGWVDGKPMFSREQVTETLNYFDDYYGEDDGYGCSSYWDTMSCD